MRQPEPLPPDIAGLLERGAVASEPPVAVRERLRSRLSTSLMSPVAHLRPMARSTAAGLAAAMAPRIYAGALAGFVVGAAGMWALIGRTTPPAPAPVVTTSVPRAPVAPGSAIPGAAGNAAVAAPLPQAAIPLAATPAVAPHRFVHRTRIVVAAIEAPVAVASAPGASPASTSPVAPIAPVAPGSHWGLLAEGELLQKGRTAMVRGDTEGAMAAVEEHANRFPHGKLVEEREALKIQALVAEDRTPEARAALGAFEHDHPKSLLGPALEEAVVGRIQ